MKGSRLKWLIGCLAVAVGSGALVWYYWLNKAGGETLVQARPVTVKVSRGSIRAAVSLDGAVKVSQTAEVRSAVGAAAADVYVREGSLVQAGQALLSLDRTEINRQIRQAEIDLELARNRLATLENPEQPEVNEQALEAARLKVEQAKLNLRNKNKEVEKLVATAPATGKLTGFSLKTGQEVTSGTQIGTVIDDREAKVTVSIPQSQIDYIQVGQEAQISTLDRALRGEVLEGSVTAISNYSSAIEGRLALYTATVTVANPGYILSGMQVDVMIKGSEQGNPGALVYITRQGTLQPQKETAFKLPATGVVDKVLVAEDDYIAEGQVVAVLANEALEAQVRQAEVDLSSAENNLAQLMNPEVKLTSERDLEDQRLRVLQAELNLEARQSSLKDYEIRAPISGIIAPFTLRPGDRVASNQVIATITNYNALQVAVEVDELDIPQIRPGLSVEVSTEALPGKLFAGKVGDIAGEGKIQGGVATFQVLIDLEKPEGLKPGMTVNSEIIVGESQDTLLLPIQAIQSTGNRQVVFLIGDDPQGGDRRGLPGGGAQSGAGARSESPRISTNQSSGPPAVSGAGNQATQASGVNGRPVEVKTGFYNDSFIEILSGLAEGDEVLLPGQSGATNFAGLRTPDGGMNLLRMLPGGAVPGGGFGPGSQGRMQPSTSAPGRTGTTR